MSTFRWWIDEPIVRGSGNPGDEDLERLRAQGFSVAVSLLEESKQPPRYAKRPAEDSGWAIYSIPVAENHAPSLEQIGEFIGRLKGLPPEMKVVVFCQSGLGRTACMGAALLDYERSHVEQGDRAHERGVFSYRLGNSRATASSH
jgi:protein tyrosine phosphatase (PTP) superfamily phosphohydrolase (DUF442 family)